MGKERGILYPRGEKTPEEGEGVSDISLLKKKEWL